MIMSNEMGITSYKVLLSHSTTDIWDTSSGCRSDLGCCFLFRFLVCCCKVWSHKPQGKARGPEPFLWSPLTDQYIIRPQVSTTVLSSECNPQGISRRAVWTCIWAHLDIQIVTAQWYELVEDTHRNMDHCLKALNTEGSPRHCSLV